MAEAPPDTAPIDTVTHIDPTTGVQLISPRAVPTAEDLTPVELPSGFLDDFPVPSGATVVDSMSASQPGGVAYRGVTIAVQRNAKDTFDWYRGRLNRLGWRIQREDQKGQTHSLHASRRGAMLTLIVEVHPEYPGTGWTRILANVLEKRGS